MFLLRRLQHAPARRLAHLCISWGFVVFFLIGSLDDLIFWKQDILDFQKGGIWFPIMNDFILGLFVFSIIFKFRNRIQPKKNQPKPTQQGSILLIFLFLVVTSGFLILTSLYSTRFSFIGTLLLTKVTPYWHFKDILWLHIIISIAFIVYLPYGMGLHAFLAPLSLGLNRNPEPASLIPKTPLFSFRERLQIEACIGCGECVINCEVIRAGNLTSDNFMPEELFAPLGKIKACKTIIQEKQKGENFLSNYSKGVFDCTLCGRCKAVCPIGINTKELMLTMREDLVIREQYPKTLNMANDAVKAEHNVLNFPNEDRTLWLDFLDDVPDNIECRDKAETLYFVGCMSSFSPAIQEIPQSLFQIMCKVGEDFTVLGGQEWCCGFPLIMGGHKAKATQLKEHNINEIRKMGVKRIIFNCPSCYYTWKNYYRPENVQLLHETEYFVELIRNGKLELNPPDARITYHDPCDLGRGCGIYDAPREVLSHWSDFVELSENREKGFCCGGGGDLEMYNNELTEKINLNLIKQLRNTGANTVAAACPQCKRMLQKELRNNNDIFVKDMAELIIEYGTLSVGG